MLEERIKEYAKPAWNDHRVIDGDIGAALLYEVIRALESPELLLLD